MLNKYKFELSNSLERLVSDKQKESITNDLGFARRYLNVLMTRLEKELNDKMEESENELNYDKPNWELKQAELLGYRRALRKVIQIIGPIEESND